MPIKPKQDQLLSTVNPVTGNLELHVTGYLLPNAVFNRILDAIKANREGKEARPVLLLPHSLDMYLILRESIPSEYYAGIKLYNPLTAEQVAAGGGYRDAAGM